MKRKDKDKIDPCFLVMNNKYKDRKKLYIRKGMR